MTYPTSPHHLGPAALNPLGAAATWDPGTRRWLLERRRLRPAAGAPTRYSATPPCPSTDRGFSAPLGLTASTDYFW